MTVLAVGQLLTCCLLLWLLFRKPSGSATNDPRIDQLVDLIARMDARGEAFESQIRASLLQIRESAAEEARRGREESKADSGGLRAEVTGSIHTLGTGQHAGFVAFRSDNAASSERLRTAIQQDLQGIRQRLDGFVADAAQQQVRHQEALHTRLSGLSVSQEIQQDKLRTVVEERLEKLNLTNAAKLEEMRVTVDEKLNATLQSRLTESFGQVTTHLGAVQKGLGEMKELATGVGDLKKVLSNVKSRGVVGEFQLGMQLEQMFSPDQYIKNARIKSNTTESVEYALKFPNGGGQGSTLLPIDAKFPKEDWERLEHAYDHGSAEEIAIAGRAFERSIRAEGKRICEKYIDPPTTMPHAIMFLPTENLYAEVVRRPGLQSDIQSNCRVTIAGPSTFMAILTSFQMGFHTLAIQKKGDEVWKVLSKAKSEFGNFGTLMDKVEKQVGTVQKTLHEISGKTTTINRALKNVSSIETGVPVSNRLGFEEIAGVAPLLAAAGRDSDLE